MKNLLLICLFLIPVSLFAQLTYVPDNNFEIALNNLGYDNGILDNFVPTANINTITSLDISSEGISDLTGIEDFIALQVLHCEINSLTTLDLSQNTLLTNLYCSDNQLTGLNVSGSPNLVLLDCNSNLLSALNVSNNTALINLICFNNQLTSLDISNNTSLSILKCRNNQLTNLDTSTNTVLTELIMGYNLFSSLNIANNTSLVKLVCPNNQLTDLDVSSNTVMTTLTCNDNSLISLNVRNGNNNFSDITFNALNNPDLFCIKALDYTYYNAILTNVDTQSYFDPSCSQVNIPDDNFEQELINLGHDNVLDDYAYLKNINSITNLNISNKNIIDLTGINSFTALEQLDCSDNLLTNISLSSLSNLESLSCYNNSLLNLNIDYNINLIQVLCQNNQLSLLDVSQNTSLQLLSCNNNQIIDLDLSQNTALIYLDCDTNNLESLNIQNGNNTSISPSGFITTSNPNLLCVEVDDVGFSTTFWTNIDAQTNFSLNCYYGETYVPDDNFEQALIDLGYDSGTLDDYVPTNNINTVTSLDISSKSITDLTGIEDFYALENLNCSSNSLIILDITQNGSLLTLDCSDNSIASIDTSMNLVLTEFNCSINQIPNLDLSLNVFLENLKCDTNLLTNLNVFSNVNLTNLDCSNNLIAALNLITNTSLSNLNCSNNQLFGLIMTNGNNTAISNANFDATANPLLTCIEVDDEIYSATNWLNIESYTSFANNCHYGETYVPDDNFEQELINLGYDSGALDDYVNTSNINSIGILDVSFKGILDLTGIEDFTSLTQLNCNNNMLTNLDLSSNVVLNYLNCSFNFISDLIITSPSVYFISASNNQLLNIDLSSKLFLTNVQLDNNQLTTLNIKNGNNTLISNFNTLNNPNLFCVEVDDVVWSTTNWTNKDTHTNYNINCNYPSIWRNFRWINGAPTIVENAIIDGNYDTNTFGSIDANSININPNKIVTINANSYMRIFGDILNNGDLIVNNEGSIVQINDVANTINNGSIVVRKTTPYLASKDFMILGNPMSAETREGVYGSGKRVLKHLTANFIPNGAVGGTTENFVDDNNNNWANHSGGLTLAEGYLVRPQSNSKPTGNYDLEYTQGTLNNGIINYNLLFNGTRLASPNMLGNPYASAIDNDLFLVANPLIDAIYYWQHITPPSGAFPGFNQLNFNLGDISVYNQGSGGVAAPNGGGIPTQFMASGQGFGVKALGLGTAVFNNAMRVTNPNTDYRTPENSDRQRIWLDLQNETYRLKSNMLIAFTQNATDYFENKYDSKRFDTPISLYSILEDETELAIQGRSQFNLEQKVPLGFKTYVEEKQTYTISIRQIEGVELESTEIYLEDRLLHTITNLSEENYSFTSNAIQQNERFVLIFRETELGITVNTIESIVVYPVPATNTIIIANPQGLDLQTATIYDLFGRVIQTIDISEINTHKTIDITNLATANYFLIIEGEQGTITKRIIKE